MDTDRKLIKLYAVIFILAALVFGIVFHFENEDPKKKYDEIWEFVLSGEYKEAQRRLSDLKWSLDEKTSVYYGCEFGWDFCVACLHYSEDDFRRAKEFSDEELRPKLDDKKHYPRFNKEQAEYVSEMIKNIDSAYAEHKAEYEEADRKFREDQEKADKILEEYREERRQKEKLNSNSTGGYHSGSSGKSSSSSSSGNSVDPMDHDIDTYYKDYKDSEGFEDEDDAWDDFEDNEDYWDDY